MQRKQSATLVAGNAVAYGGGGRRVNSPSMRWATHCASHAAAEEELDAVDG